MQRFQGPYVQTVRTHKKTFVRPFRRPRSDVQKSFSLWKREVLHVKFDTDVRTFLHLLVHWRHLLVMSVKDSLKQFQINELDELNELHINFYR